MATRKPTPSEYRSDVGSPAPILRAFLIYLRDERRLAENSVFAYRRDLEDFQAFLKERGTSLAKLSLQDITAYSDEQLRIGKSKPTVFRRIAAIRLFVSHRVAIGHDPGIDLSQIKRPKLDQSPPKVLTAAEVGLLISAPDPHSPLFTRDVAILHLLYRSGLRATELCDLKTGDIDFSRNFIEVKGKKTRIVPLAQDARAAVESYLSVCRPKLDNLSSDRLFLSESGKPLERVALWMRIEKHSRASALPNAVSPHILRHSFARSLAAGGTEIGQIGQLLGNRSHAANQIYKGTTAPSEC